MIQIGNKEVASITIGGKEVQTITIGGKTAFEKQQDTTDYFYIENTYAGTNTLTLSTTQTGSPTAGTYTTSVQYSKDKSTWTTLTLTAGGSNTISLNQGEKVYFRNDNGKWSNYVSSSQNMLNIFTASNSHIVGGNANTLLNYTDLNNVALTEGCFHGMFRNNTTITGANLLSLPSMTLARMCYTNMFRDCSSLTSIPTLPATTLNENCYSNMFLGTAITTPPVLPATTMTRSCYLGMFRDCTSLTTAPVLGSTSLYEYCYRQMFRGCTSLTVAPELPATTLAENCYSEMFYGCTSLNSVTTYANNISATNCLSNWLNGVAASGDFYNFGSATYSSGESGIPAGWTQHKIKMTNAVLTPATGTEYSVTANLEWSSNLTWTSAEINISNSDQGAGNRNAYLTFTPSEVSNGLLTATNNIDIYFQDPDTWFTLTVYNNGTIVDTQYVPYTISYIQ